MVIRHLPFYGQVYDITPERELVEGPADGGVDVDDRVGLHVDERRAVRRRVVHGHQRAQARPVIDVDQLGLEHVVQLQKGNLNTESSRISG